MLLQVFLLCLYLPIMDNTLFVSLTDDDSLQIAAVYDRASGRSR